MFPWFILITLILYCLNSVCQAANLASFIQYLNPRWTKEATLISGLIVNSQSCQWLCVPLPSCFGYA